MADDNDKKEMTVGDAAFGTVTGAAATYGIGAAHGAWTTSDEAIKTAKDKIPALQETHKTAKAEFKTAIDSIIQPSEDLINTQRVAIETKAQEVLKAAEEKLTKAPKRDKASAQKAVEAAKKALTKESLDTAAKNAAEKVIKTTRNEIKNFIETTDHGGKDIIARVKEKLNLKAEDKLPAEWETALAHEKGAAFKTAEEAVVNAERGVEHLGTYSKSWKEAKFLEKPLKFLEHNPKKSLAILGGSVLLGAYISNKMFGHAERIERERSSNNGSPSLA